MELQELMELADGVEVARFEELKTRRALIDAQEAAETVKATALAMGYRDGVIDGKNAEIRKQQEVAFITINADYIDAMQEACDAQDVSDCAVAKLAGVEARYGLVKAWLYSQAKIG